jgi:hypothetical protein
MRVQFVASSGEGQFEFRACIAAATYIHAYEVLQLAYVLQTKLRFFSIYRDAGSVSAQPLKMQGRRAATRDKYLCTIW